MTLAKQKDPVTASAMALHRKKVPMPFSDGVLVDPLQEACLVAKDWNGGVEAIINAGVRVYECIKAFEKDDKRIDTFIRALEENGVLTRNEARQGLESPKLIKLRTIGEHADLLRRPDISRSLGPSYTTLYQLVVLFKKLEGDKEAKTSKLLDVLAAATEASNDDVNKAVTRQFLSRRTAREKRSANAAKRTSGKAATDAGAATPTLSGLIAANAEFDLLVMDVSGKRALLGDDYATGYGLDNCLPLYTIMAERRAIVILAKLSDYPAIATKLMPVCGFRRRPEVLQLRKPTGTRVTEAEILVTVSEGGLPPDLQALSDWLPEDETVDILALASHLYPSSARKLHVFADTASAGWTCLVGDDNTWIRKPTLR